MITQGSSKHDSITFDLNYLNKSKDNPVNMNVHIIVQCLLSELSRTEQIVVKPKTIAW